MHNKTKILFISTIEAPFVKDDLDNLANHFTVNKKIGHGVWHVFKIIIGVSNSDLIFCWFASVYSFIGVLIGKFFGIKSIIVVGGVDVAKSKELNYGIWLSWWKSKLVRYSLYNADRVLVGDLSMKESAMTLAEYDGENISYLPPGFDCEFWRSVVDKEPIVLTVAVVQDEQRMTIKGIPILVEAARNLPTITFVVVGVDPQLALHLQPPMNMTFFPRMSRNELLPFYQQAKVYCQPSVQEAVSYTLREAMLCGCIPVVSDIGGMPTAAAGIGLLVPPNDAMALAGALQEAMKMNDTIGAKARARIVALYSEEKREKEILRVIKELLD